MPSVSCTIRNERGEKYCKAGDHWLPEDGFAVNRASKDGRQYSCRECRKIYSRNNYSRGLTCQDCGKPVVNHSTGRCSKCRGISQRGKAYTKGWSYNAAGYVVLSGQYGHPNANARGLLLEHTKVMSETLGRPLRKGENVHHVNGIRDDNRPENLELWVSSQPSGQRVEDQVRWAREILAIYGHEFPARTATTRGTAA